MSDNHLKDMDYGTYLGLDRILDAQHMISAADPKRKGEPAHDEMLFIIVHQAYELWFKLILFEMSRVQDIFSEIPVADRDLRPVVASMERIVETLKLLVQQLDVLETMTPLDFLEFRHVFRSASGFQSAQFRELEIRLGLRRDERMCYGGHAYDVVLPQETKDALEAWENKPSLFEQFENWLSRTPFVDTGSYKFWDSYRAAVYQMLDEDLQNSPDEDRSKIEKTRASFDELFASDEPAGWRFSAKALQAALFINMYRDQPVLHQPYRILHLAMDIDELLTVWRYRHALMVQRMIGMKSGSGGSSGHRYLIETAERHRVFSDLFGLSTFLIPRSARPELPEDVQKQMAFVYEGAAA
ncbi:MAG: tryptophan 2,3-dioxygenase [Pseudomonadota bacterium]|jgi:tryptophan 2,3-dioxygenase|nr:tryptophan 2,3-dioxygenase [Pseudomonadota bacterium]QKK05042.1 MAG: tryptophan 2,3-dioxygenase [Pseudomonadota bacterium]